MMELQAAATIAASAPAHWYSAPLLQAPLYESDADGLRGVDSPLRIAVAPALNVTLLATTAGGIVIAQAADGGIWRLQRVPVTAVLWRVQALDESRRAGFLALRAAAAARLTAQVLHELRNPMNALSLHGDLLGRLLTPGAPVHERAGNSLKVIRDRLQDLGSRQNHAVQFWLGDFDAADEPPVAIAFVVDEVLRLLRGLFVLGEIRLNGTSLDVLDTAARPRSGAALRLALIVLLLSAYDRACNAAQGDAREVRLHVSTDGAGLMLACEAPCGLLQVPDVAAQLALLLEAEGASLQVHSSQVVRLRLPHG